jgi:hypothetical protein
MKNHSGKHSIKSTERCASAWLDDHGRSGNRGMGLGVEIHVEEFIGRRWKRRRKDDVFGM